MFLCLLLTTVLTNLADVSSSLAKGQVGARFSVEGTVLIPGRTSNTLFKASDSRTSIDFRDITRNASSRSLSAGTQVRIAGEIRLNVNGYPAPCCTNLTVLANGTPPRVPSVSAREMATGAFDNRLVRVRGIVREAFRDEIDPSYIYLLLDDGGETFFASSCDDHTSAADLNALIGATVSAVGACSASAGGTLRRFLGRMVTISAPSGIAIEKPAPKDPFDVPLLGDLTVESPAEIIALHRRRLVGRVLAVRPGKDFLIRDPSGLYHGIRTGGDELPSYGEEVEVAGTPETDLYRINLANAIWRRRDAEPLRDEPAAVLSAADILTDGNGHAKIRPAYHGRAVRLVGTIMDLPTTADGSGVLTVKSGGFSIPIDIGANRSVGDGLTVGCRIAVSGTCIIECENWRPASTFPHATGITLVVRTPKDVTVLSRPSWWTPRRLMIVVGILLLTLVVIFIWNRILQRIVDRKSRQLLKEQVGQIKAALRVDERTHLAVELHDSLSQNLSGVACQLTATRETLPADAHTTRRHLETAERMLLSCRTELRRCLWDLRGETLENLNFTDAILKTLAPVAQGVETAVRFNIPRARLSDTTAHAVLCIIRELVSNAIRHGRASVIRIAGELHDNTLSFSVRDNGCGFDPAACAGPAEGHFGLEGIRERIRRIGGKMTVDSSAAGGTRVEITLTSAATADAGKERP